MRAIVYPVFHWQFNQSEFFGDEGKRNELSVFRPISIKLNLPFIGKDLSFLEGIVYRF